MNCNIICEDKIIITVVLSYYYEQKVKQIRLIDIKLRPRQLLYA